MNTVDHPSLTKPLQLIGVPSDSGAGRLGAAMGPDALRVAGLQPALEMMGLQVSDIGNLAGPPNLRSERDPDHAGLRNFDTNLLWNQRVHDAVLRSLEAAELPIMMGGDHAFAMGSISAVARYCRSNGKTLRVLWLDAHADCNTPESSPSGNVHGIPVASLCGLGPQSFTSLAGHEPAVSPEQLCLIGLRSVDDQEKRILDSLHIEAYDMRAIDELGMREVMQRALRGLDGPEADSIHLHVSFDVDFLDPSIAPGTGTTVRGGPDYREAQLCMEMIADTGLLRSLDVVELNPALDSHNQTAELVVDLLQSLFGKSTLLRRDNR